MVLKLPLRLTAICWSNIASSLSATFASFMMPALLTRTSMPPKVFSAWSNIACTAAALPTSALTASARPPPLSIFAASASAGLASPE